MKRLTVHLNRVRTNSEKRTVKGILVDKNIIRNTVSYTVANEDEAKKIIANINEHQKPRGNVKKWYLSNIR